MVILSGQRQKTVKARSSGIKVDSRSFTSCLLGLSLNFVLCSYCMLVGLCWYVNLHKVFVWPVMLVGLFWFLESISLLFVFLRWPLGPQDICQCRKGKVLYERAALLHESSVIFKCINVWSCGVIQTSFSPHKLRSKESFQLTSRTEFGLTVLWETPSKTPKMAR